MSETEEAAKRIRPFSPFFGRMTRAGAYIHGVFTGLALGGSISLLIYLLARTTG